MLVGRDNHLVASLDLHIFVVQHNARTHLRALGVQSKSERTARSFALDLATVFNHTLKVSVVTMTRVQTNNVDTSVPQLVQRLDIVCLRTDRCDDRGLTHRLVLDLILDRIE